MECDDGASMVARGTTHQHDDGDDAGHDRVEIPATRPLSQQLQQLLVCLGRLRHDLSLGVTQAP